MDFPFPDLHTHGMGPIHLAWAEMAGPPWRPSPQTSVIFFLQKWSWHFWKSSGAQIDHTWGTNRSDGAPMRYKQAQVLGHLSKPCTCEQAPNYSRCQSCMSAKSRILKNLDNWHCWGSHGLGPVAWIFQIHSRGGYRQDLATGCLPPPAWEAGNLEIHEAGNLGSNKK